MLGYASVRSTVMQAAGMAPTSLAACGEPTTSGMSMPGMGHIAADAMRHLGDASGKGAKHQAACPYCSAAANTALVGGIAAPRAPMLVVFVALHSVASHGPRGPPAFEARARGPPLDLTPA